MARVTVEDCLKEVNNRFLLVMLASKRVKQLYKGSKPVIENKSSNKNVVLALREIASGKIRFEMTSRRNR
jgi:DNA-directed RNA polymerase subunit omega